MEGGRFELPNPKERIYSPPRLATSLPLHLNMKKWCRREDLNPQPTDYKSVALPIELHRQIWWRMTGSNRRPSACKADALPAELILHYGDPYGIRTRVTAVKGRCLNRLTKGPSILVVYIKRASNRARTGDLFLTMEVLYLLSYGSSSS